ncbi:MAG TPA: DUF1932 domain-containing protein [Pseudomonadales bacterium]|nr:DUF1932 domain-containing protein [Pseudomonadales bacterium]
MTTETVGIIHPGAMGSSIGAALAGRAELLFAGEGRSAATLERAAADGIRDVGTLAALVAEAGIIVSVCPPHAAQGVARDLLASGFKGLLVDANAISPASARLIGQRIEASGASYVDGGIIGPPARGRGTTTLLLSGKEAPRVAELFAGTGLEPRVIDDRAGSASALKMAFSAWTKGTTALLASIRAYAQAEGVDEALQAQWQTLLPDLAEGADARIAASGPKAWRYVGEMKEISRAFGDHDLPEGFHMAAADIFRVIAASVEERGGAVDSDALIALLADRGTGTAGS